MRCYLICFDIEDDKIRTQAGKLILSYGDRVQKSVFEVAFNRPEDMRRLQTELQALLEPDDDLRFYYLSDNCRQNSHDLHDKPVAQFPGVILI